jgi:hypothetical protein
MRQTAPSELFPPSFRSFLVMNFFVVENELNKLGIKKESLI